MPHIPCTKMVWSNHWKHQHPDHIICVTFWFKIDYPWILLVVLKEPHPILSCQTGLKDFCLLLSFRKKLRKRNPPSKEGLGFLPFFKERQRYPDYPVNPVLFEHILWWIYAQTFMSSCIVQCYAKLTLDFGVRPFRAHDSTVLNRELLNP